MTVIIRLSTKQAQRAESCAETALQMSLIIIIVLQMRVISIDV